MIYLHKFLPWLLSPLGISILLILIGLIFRKLILCFVALLVLLFFSNSFVANSLFAHLEKPLETTNNYMPNKLEYVVVLSGMLDVYKTTKESIVEWNDPDRFFKGIELVKNGKANYIIFTASKLPWQKNLINEGKVLKAKAIELGIKEKQIIVTENVYNTFTESEAIKKIIPENSSFYLVTSAFHMKRALSLFEKQQLKAYPVAVDFRVKDYDFTYLDLIPNLQSLNLSTIAVRELLGRFYYSIFFL